MKVAMTREEFDDLMKAYIKYDGEVGDTDNILVPSSESSVGYGVYIMARHFDMIIPIEIEN